MKKIAISLLLLLFLLSSVSLAVPHEINYQGVLKDSSGALVSGEVNMTFHIYDGAGSTATSLWDETQNGVTVEAGLYNVRLGSVNPIDPATFEGNTRYLGVTVGTDSEMEPRIPLISVPYAFRAEQVGGLVAGDFVRFGTSSTQETSEKYGLYVKSSFDNNDSIGVFGESSSPGGGPFEAAGVHGLASNTTGIGVGIYGQSEGVNGFGVLGEAKNSSGLNYGVYGRSNSPDGYGIHGENFNSGTAGFFRTFSSTNYALEAVNFTGTAVRGSGSTGVSGEGSSIGVYGKSSDSMGVYGEGYHFGVVGKSDIFAGVYGIGADGKNVLGGDFYNEATNNTTPTLRAQYGGTGNGPIFVLIDHFTERFRVMKNGDVYVKGASVHDIAETFKIAEMDIEAGDVVVADSDLQVKKCSKAYDSALVGVVSTKPTITMGDSETDNGDPKKPIALTGIVPTKVDASFGAVKVGDLLTTSNTPGYAMKATDPKIGTVLGKVLEPLASGKGKIMVLVTLQ
jgi:hypothetical protein